MSNNRITKRIRNSAIIKSPLLFEAVGLCPVVAIALSLKQAFFLAVVTTLEMVICEVLASAFLKNVRRYWRVALYVVFGISIIYPIMHLTKIYMPDLTINFGVYLPLMAVNSLIPLHCERVAVKNNVAESIVDAISASISYGTVAILVGAARELMAKGTIGGIELHTPVKVPAILMPFGALIIIGFLAAALKAFIGWKYPNASPDRAFNTSEIRRPIHGSLRELMRYEDVPFDEKEDASFVVKVKESENFESAVISSQPEEVKKLEPTKAPKIKKEKTPKQKKEKVKVEKVQPKTVSNSSVAEESKDEKKEELKPVIVKRPTKEKPKKSKLKPSSAPVQRRTTEGRSYLDDFSDMLVDLEEYKSKEKPQPTEADDGGREQ